MKSNNSDRFEGNINSNTFLVDEGSNFFLADDNLVSNKQTTVSEPTRRLNDYDFNLLREDAYKDVSDDLFKLEYKISRIETELRNIDAQIQAANDIQDYKLLDELYTRKSILQEDYEALIAIYNDKSLSAKISDGISNLLGDRIKTGVQVFNEKFAGMSQVILSKLPKQFSSIIELKKSLSKLENINKSVDELVNLNIPYGENIDKYEQLSKYIIKANSIQTEIARYMKK